MGVEYYIAQEERTEALTARLRASKNLEPYRKSELMDPLYMVGTRSATKPLPTFALDVVRSFLEEVNADTRLVAIGNSRGIESIGDLIEYMSRSDVVVTNPARMV